MLLVIDVGNTNIVMGIFSGDKLAGQWRLTSRKQTADEVGFMISGFLGVLSIKKEDVEGVVYASVVPSLDSMFIEGLERHIGAPYIKVGAGLDTGLAIKMKNPSGIGADRLLNAVAGIEKYGAPLIVVDLGTAITLDVIDRDGAYLGGTISPGMELSIESLSSKTAKLPQITLTAPDNFIGGDTAEAIRSGVVNGCVGMVEHLLDGVFKELGGRCKVVATGGHAGILAELSPYVNDVDEWLTLDGLRIIYERNRELIGGQQGA